MIRRVPFAGALNFRDIGGYPVAGGGATRWRAVLDQVHGGIRQYLLGPCGMSAQTLSALRANLAG